MKIVCGNCVKNGATQVRHNSIQEVRDCYARLAEADYWAEYDEGPCCSLCDAPGHGYPGGGPCPLEMRGAEDTYAEAQWEASRGVIQFEDAFADAMMGV